MISLLPSKMKYNTVLAYVLATSSFSIGCVFHHLGMMDKRRGRETQLASCHQNLRQYLPINMNRLPRHPRGRLVHLCRLMGEGFHNAGNLRIKLEGRVRGFCLARSASVTCGCLGERQVHPFLGAHCPGTADPSSDKHHTESHTTWLHRFLWSVLCK